MLPPGGNVALAEFLVTGRATSRLVEVPGEPRAAALARVPTPVAPPPPAASIPANEARPRVSFGVRLGYSKALGDVEGNTNMDEWIASQVPLQVDALVRLGRRLSLGVYGSYGFGRGGADVSAICGRAGATCLLQIFRAGVQAEVEFTPGALTPWMAAGIGYEWNAFHTEDGTLTGAADVMYRGIELLNVQGGAEWRLAPGFSCGPFLMASMGWYDRGSVRGTGAPGTGRIGEETIHTWAEVGIRSRFGF